MTARGAALEFAARRTVVRQTLVSGCALLACLLVAADAPADVRAPVVITFLCLVPGAALVGLLSPDSYELEIALAIALSVALSGLTAAFLVYTGLWSPTAVVLIVAVISLVGGLRDVRLGGRAPGAPSRFVGLLGVAGAGVRHGVTHGLPVAIEASARFARRGARGLLALMAAATKLARTAVMRFFVVIATVLRGARRALVVLSVAVTELGRRAGMRRRLGVALVACRQLVRPAVRRAPSVAAVRPAKATAHRPRSAQAAAPAPSESSLQSFLLEELRQRSRSNGGRRRRSPRSLTELEPHELDDLLSWAALQRFVTHRAVQQVDPELWFVDDLERQLGRQKPESRTARRASKPLRVPRGVWITGVSKGRSVPIAWRVLEENARGKEWRTRIALEAIDTLPGLTHDGAVVAAGPVLGSLSGFRAALEERGIRYLLRVDAVTAARELTLERPSNSAEAREVIGRRLADGAAMLVAAQPNGTKRKSELMLVQGVERMVLCEVPAEGHLSVFWLSNLEAGTPVARLASLIRLAHRHHAERTIHDLVLSTLGTEVARGAELQQQLALVALAQGLNTLGVSAAPARKAVEA